MNSIRNKIVISAIGIILILAGSLANATVIGSNILMNGNAENGMVSWTPTTGGFQTQNSGWYSISAPEGSKFFTGGSSNTPSTAAQSINISDLSALVDSGSLGVSLSAWLGGWASQNDNMVIVADLLDGTLSSLATLIIGPVQAADRSNLTGFLYRSNALLLPTGTRSIEVTMTATRTAGTYNDGYADDVKLVLSEVADVPEPATVALIGIGLAGLRFRKKRQT